MIMNPKRALDEGIVTDLVDPAIQVQPNGIDLTIGEIREIGQGSIIDFDNTKRRIVDGSIVNMNLMGEYEIDSGRQYLIRFNETVSIPNDVCGYFFPRSSLLRSGCFIASSLWDSGYNGKGCVLLVAFADIILTKNARVGQIIFEHADSAKLYSGTYKGEGIKKKRNGFDDIMP